jgi:hypothetical protein
VVELEKPFHSGKPRPCHKCRKEHARQALHLSLDSTGHVMVASSILAKHWLRLELAGLQVANQVENAPTHYIGAVDDPTIQVVEMNLNGHHNADPFYVPGRTKYESEAVIRKPLQPIIDAKAEQEDRKATAKKARKRRLFILGRRTNG